MQHAVEKTFLVAQPVQLVALASRGMLPSGDQSVAATANDESLQVRVRKGTPPEGRSSQHPLALKVPNNKQKGVSSKSVKCCTIAKGDRLRARPV